MKYNINIDFTLSKKNWSKEYNLRYDIIIGRDLMKKLEIAFNFNNERLIHYDAIVPMGREGANHHNPTLNRSKIKQVVKQTKNPKVTKETTEIIVKHLNSQFKKMNLKGIYQSSHQLYAEEKVILLYQLK